MSDWLIEYLPSVISKDIPALAPVIKARVKLAVEKKLAKNPIAFGKPLTTNLGGRHSLRVGDWRIIYELEKERCAVIIIKIGHRREVYDG